MVLLIRLSDDLRRPTRREEIAKAPLMFDYPSMPRQPFSVMAADAKGETKDFPQEIIK